MELTITKRTEVTDHTTRHELNNGWFIDNERVRACTQQGEKFELFAPGSSKGGTALCIGWGKTLKSCLREAERLLVAHLVNPNFGTVYGDPAKPSFITREGIAVWMWRKGQKVRFYTAEGVQIGPEQSNVAPALCAAYAAGWVDPSAPAWLNLGCQLEVTGGVFVRQPELVEHESELLAA